MDGISKAPGAYSGENGTIFKLAMKVGLLTLVTLGIYRFWGKTRIRKYIWSSTSLGGDRFEYTGTGLEKFLGFLIAIVFLAVYLGIIQMLLFYFGINIFVDPETASPQQVIAQLMGIYISIFAVVPFLLFAQYRARRYKLARTRFRGIRFGMEDGAWAYVLRAIGHNLLTIVTLGILLPRQTFYLEKFMSDRMWYGDARFEQQGKWTELYGAMKHLLIGLAIMIVGVGIGAALESGGLLAVALIVGYIWLIVGSIHYGVQSFGYLTRNKVLGGDVTFGAEPKTGTVLGTWLIGTLVIGVGAALGIFALAVIVGSDAAFSGTGRGPGVFGLIIGGVGYIALLLALGAAALALITQPIIKHYVETITLYNMPALDAIHQRAADKGADAEGFADALDIGGAI